MDFLGWADFARPQRSSQALQQKLNEIIEQDLHISRFAKSKPKQDSIQLILDCYRKPKGETMSFGRSNKLRGVLSRVAIVACLHFDFDSAIKILSLKNQLEPEQSQAFAKHEFQESESNISLLCNVLKIYRDMQSEERSRVGKSMIGHPSSQTDFIGQRIKVIQGMNRDLHLQMSNPYFKLFFILFNHSSATQKQAIAQISALNIDTLDCVAVLLRFFPIAEVLAELKNSLNEGVLRGDLSVIPLLGLNSPQTLRLVQNYVDSTSDI
mmetsp:Transcript_14635/g.24939  ORF Transcript_14635/g.24939 Transcript_14635/m.24939 type:complete len:267 (+) Transcript_14635:1658-2458(+)